MGAGNLTPVLCKNTVHALSYFSGHSPAPFSCMQDLRHVPLSPAYISFYFISGIIILKK